jgi:hypothetical protein
LLTMAAICVIVIVRLLSGERWHSA